MNRAAVAATGLVVLLAGCGNATGRPAAGGTRWESRPGGVEVPAAEPVDGGAFEAARQRPGPDPSARRTPGPGPSREFGEGGLHVSVDSCELLAPRRWVFRGQVRRPAGHDTLKIALSVGFLVGDLVNGETIVDVVVHDDGAWALGLDLPPPRNGAVVSVSERLGRCSAGVFEADVPVDPKAQSVGPAPVVSGEALEYRAPEGTVQAFGIGAHLEETDARVTWAYRAWQGRSLPFDTVWVPDPDSGIVVSELIGGWSKLSFCRTVTTTTRTGAQVMQTSECTLPPEEQRRTRVGPVDGSDGFTLYQTSHHGRWVAERVDGDERVTVGGHDRAEVERTVRALRRVRNTVVEERPPGPYGADLDAAIAKAMTNGHVYRDRVPWPGGRWLVVSTRTDPPQPGVTHENVFVHFATRSSSGWTVGGGGGGGYGGCVYAGSGYLQEQGSYYVVMAKDPAHGVQRLEGTTWRTLPTVRGIHAAESGALTRFRAIDPATGEVRCSQQ